jgi:hypothetical protein
MATSYDDIYNTFLEKITDYDLLAFTDANKEVILYGYMIRACSKFQNICEVDLSDRDETLDQFNEDLDDEIIDIITTGMTAEWLKPKYLFDDHMKNMLNTSDYKLAASPANMLGSIRETYLQTKKEFESMMNKYSYVHGSIEDLEP